MDNTKKIMIKKGTVITTLSRSDLVSVSETHDGISFNFKDGQYLYITDAAMPSHYKSKIKLTVDKFKNVDIEIDLLNGQNPIKAFA